MSVDLHAVVPNLPEGTKRAFRREGIASVSVDQVRVRRRLQNVTLLDPAPPFAGALSRSKHGKEAAQWHCQITIFRINEINEIAFV